MAAFAAPSSRTARLFTSVLAPVAQDTSGQSASTVHASKPRVMESPTAATEDGLESHNGVGDGDGFASRARVPEDPSASPPPVRHNAARPRTAAVVPASTARACRFRFRIRWCSPRSSNNAPL